MLLTLLALVLQLVSVVCFLFVLLHAFRTSVGTGFMVLCIPVYNLYYGFAQFEHRLKGWILAGWLGTFVVSLVLRFLAIQLSQGPGLG